MINELQQPLPRWTALPGDPPELRRELALLRAQYEPDTEPRTA